MRFSTLQKANGQQGMALILAIGFLAVLSILGAVVLQVSMRDLKSSSATKPRQNAFYAADRAVEYAMNRDIVMTLPVGGTVDLIADDVKKSNNTTIAGLKHKTVIDDAGPGWIESGSVSDLGPRNLPPHMAAMHGSDFGANLYHVHVKASATLSQPAHIDANIVRLFKMDSDQIFRTSSGG